MIRRVDDLTLMLSVAEQLPEDQLAELEAAAAAAPLAFRPEKQRMAAHVSKLGPARVERTADTDLLPTTALVRFDKKRRMDARCLLRDRGNAFDTKTDVLAALANQVNADSPAFLNMVAELDACDALWEMAKALMLLPAYLDARALPSRERSHGKLR